MQDFTLLSLWEWDAQQGFLYFFIILFTHTLTILPLPILHCKLGIEFEAMLISLSDT